MRSHDGWQLRSSRSRLCAPGPVLRALPRRRAPFVGTLDQNLLES